MDSKDIFINENDALVIVDMQKDFCHPDGALYVAGVSGEPDMSLVIKSVLNLALRVFGYRAETRDEHPPAGHVEFDIYKGTHVVIGTSGAALVDSLAAFVLPLIDRTIVKGHDKALISYSAAVSLDWGKLIGDLRDRGMKRVFVCGVAFTHCAGETALDIAKQGFDTYIVRDATRSVPPPYGDPDLMEKKLAIYGVKTVMMADIT